jgi:hypothetical protein
LYDKFATPSLIALLGPINIFLLQIFRRNV